jgi:hypothetical protein
MLLPNYKTYCLSIYYNTIALKASKTLAKTPLVKKLGVIITSTKKKKATKDISTRNKGVKKITKYKGSRPKKVLTKEEKEEKKAKRRAT